MHDLCYTPLLIGLGIAHGDLLTRQVHIFDGQTQTFDPADAAWSA
jgi:hypothetical protein